MILFCIVFDLHYLCTRKSVGECKICLSLPFKPFKPYREKHGKERFKDRVHGNTRVCRGNPPFAR